MNENHFVDRLPSGAPPEQTPGREDDQVQWDGQMSGRNQPGRTLGEGSATVMNAKRGAQDNQAWSSS